MSEKSECECGECDRCHAECVELTKRLVMSQRGRWLVVYEDGTAYRMQSKAASRSHIRQMNHFVGNAHLRRYRRDRVEYVGDVLVTDARWAAPTTRPQ